ncbi:MAG: hypothetical protein II891_05480 [Bacteroidales bacterium]|nr:hypothetical protein [Bacteroidales bacterium]
MKRIASLVFFMFLVLAKIAAQDDFVPSYPTGPSVVSPQVAQMARYDSPTIALGSGAPHVTIPLVGFSDADFNIDISLTYSSTGFKPLATDNFTGMGWHLNCGGVIMREIHGIPDEWCKIGTTTGYAGCQPFAEIDGFLMGYPGTAAERSRIASILESHNPDSLKAVIRDASFGKEGKDICGVFRDYDVEVSPDVYTFNFCGHSGKFIIGLDGKPVVVSDNGGRYQVDLTQFRYRENPNQDTQSMIRITTDDGYVYSFGGTFESLEYMALNWIDFTNHSGAYEAFCSTLEGRKNKVVAFHLTSVRAPNGRTLTVQYKDMVPAVMHVEPERILFSQSQLGYNWDQYKMCYSVSASLSVGEFEFGDIDSAILSYHLNKTALPISIRTDSEEVLLSYEASGSPFFDLSRHGSNFHYYDKVRECGAKLTSVRRRSLISDTEIERADLTYSVNHGRLLLTRVASSKSGNYDLSYYPVDPRFTTSVTIDIDKWGYWSGYGANTSIRQLAADEAYSFPLPDMTRPRKSGDRNREPTGVDIDAFMLREVIFPTGGGVEYTYEPHDYSDFFVWNSGSGYMNSYKSLASRKKMAGGARVFSERLHGGEAAGDERTVYYRYDLGPLAGSSGTLLSTGDDYLQAYFFRDQEGLMKISLENWSCYMNNPVNLGGYIQYGNVRQYETTRKITIRQADSTFSFSRYPMEAEHVRINQTIRYYGPQAGESSWWFHGYNTSFQIRELGGPVVFSHTFTQSAVDLILNPYSEFGTGTYVIEADIPAMDVFNFRAVYPDYFDNGSAYEGLPYKETLFSRVPPKMADNYFWMADYPNHDYATLAEEFGNTLEERQFSRYCRKESWGLHFSAAEDWSPNGGKPLYETYYDKLGNKQKETHYTYGQFFTGNGYYVNTHPYVPATLIMGHANIVRIPMYSYLLTGKTVTDYGPGGTALVTAEHTEYDTEGYGVLERKTSPDGRTLVKHYSRVKDQADSVSQLMQFYNMVAPVVAEDWTDSSGTVIYRRRNIFESKSNLSFPVLGEVALSYDDAPPVSHVRYPVYDDRGRIVQGEEDGVNTVYLWGYRGQYVVAVIENARAEQVRQALGVVTLSDISLADSPDFKELEGLRQALPQSRISTYKYIPGVGICEATALDGFKTYYSYDSKGRLASISVDDENGVRSIVSTYEYHLVND